MESAALEPWLVLRCLPLPLWWPRLLVGWLLDPLDGFPSVPGTRALETVSSQTLLEETSPPPAATPSSSCSLEASTMLETSSSEEPESLYRCMEASLPAFVGFERSATSIVGQHDC